MLLLLKALHVPDKDITAYVPNKNRYSYRIFLMPVRHRVAELPTVARRMAGNEGISSAARKRLQMVQKLECRNHDVVRGATGLGKYLKE